jgi:predicted DNA-binding transcriptional regulator AlpA
MPSEQPLGARLSFLDHSGSGGGVRLHETATLDIANSLPLLVSAKTLAVLLSVSEATIWRWDSGGRLPQAVKPSPGVKRWRREEIREWIDVGCPCRKDWEAMKKANKQ